MPTPTQPEPTQLNHMTWSAAFAALVDLMRREYVFDQWKGIDWDALAQRIEPRINAAEANDDKRAYYLALREFAYAIPDANLELWGDDQDLARATIGGTYGFGIVQLDDSRVFVSHLAPGGSAARAGVQRAAQIVGWNDMPIQAALDCTSIVWTEHPPATRTQSRLEQCRFLPRAPVGTRVRVQFQNPRARGAETVELVAQSAAREVVNGLSRSPMAAELYDSGISRITFHRLPEESVPGRWSQTLYDHMRGRLLHFSRHKARALVVDLRGCTGTNHQLAVRLAGFFHRQPLFYAVAGYRDTATRRGKLKPDPRTLLRVLPQDVYWNLPVAVLVNAETRGAAEGFARALEHTEHCTVIGTTTSGGAFGSITSNPMSQVWLPEGYTVNFAWEAALNQDGVIQIESNRFGEGGVRPDVCVPRTLRTFEEQFLQGRDVELEYAMQVLNHKLQSRRGQ